jgi:K(+)-stimulated pyrophosphate-energized sodium pump
MMLPLAIGAACVVTSIIGTFFVKLGANNNDHGRALQGLHRHRRALARRALPVTSLVFGGMSVTTAAAARPSPAMDLFWCGVVGLVVTGLIIWITEYYTGTG